MVLLKETIEQMSDGPKDRQLELYLSDYVPSSYVTGKEWEKLFAWMATERGLVVAKMHHSCPYDLVCNGWRVQCKSIRYVDYCGAGRREGRLRISRGSGCSAANNYSVGDFDVFAVFFESQVFIMPVASVGVINGKIRRRVALSKLMSHKDNWDALSETGSQPAQLGLFDD